MGTRSKGSSSSKPVPTDLGKGAAAGAAKKVVNRNAKNDLARIRAKQALGAALTDDEKMRLRRANQGTGDSQ